MRPPMGFYAGPMESTGRFSGFYSALHVEKHNHRQISSHEASSTPPHSAHMHICCKRMELGLRILLSAPIGLMRGTLCSRRCLSRPCSAVLTASPAEESVVL